MAGVYRHVWGAGLGGCAGGGYPPYLGYLLGGVVAHGGVAGREGEMGCGRGGGHSTVFTGLGRFLWGRGGVRYMRLRNRLAEQVQALGKLLQSCKAASLARGVAV